MPEYRNEVTIANELKINTNEVNLKKSNSEPTKANNTLIDKGKESPFPTIKPELIDLDTYCQQAIWSMLNDSSDTIFLDSINIMDVWASSELDPEGEYDYYSKNTHDFNLSTVWCEGQEGYGIGEFIQYTLEKDLDPFTISHIDIINEYIKSEGLWKANSRVKKMRLWINGVETAIFQLDDSMKVQRFFIDEVEAKEGTTIGLEILDVYKGDTYDDVVVTEVQFGGEDGNGSKIDTLTEIVLDITMILDETTKGIIPYIAQDHLELHLRFSIPADKASVYEAFCNNNSNSLTKEQMEFNWIDEQNLVIKLSNLEKGLYKALFKSAQDQYGNEYYCLTDWADGCNDFNITSQNQVYALDISSKNFVDELDIPFSNIQYESDSLSPYSDHYLYRYHFNYEPSGGSDFIPFIYDQDQNKWSQIKSYKPLEDHHNSRPELVWLNEQLVYLDNALYNLEGDLVHVFDLLGQVIGINSSLDGSIIAVFAGEEDQPLTLYVYDATCKQLLYQHNMPFTYAYYVECNQSTFYPLRFQWLDENSMLVEGWNRKGDEYNYVRGVPSLFEVDLEGDVRTIINNIWSIYLGNDKIFAVYDFLFLTQMKREIKNHPL